MCPPCVCVRARACARVRVRRCVSVPACVSALRCIRGNGLKQLSHLIRHSAWVCLFMRANAPIGFSGIQKHCTQTFGRHTAAMTHHVRPEVPNVIDKPLQLICS